MPLDRYRSIVPDWRAFTRAAATPEPVTLRANTLRIEVGALRERLEGAGFRLEPVEGLPAFLRVLEEPFPVSRTLEHWLGLFYLQQAVTGVAPPALGARPGERILDLCAAPGGKTSHLAERMGEEGSLVAVEVNEGRMRALVGNLFRLGHAGVLTVQGDGRALPGGAVFDRVLVDAPCSGEGNLRKRRSPARPPPDSFRQHIAGVQRALLRRAVELVRPGGTVLYVTCTFAPEENEGIVARALERLPVTLETIDLDVPHSPGLTSFEGADFPAEMERAWRLYPEHLDSGGLFMARLRRSDDTDADVAGDAAAAPANDHPSPGDASRGWTPVPPAYPDVPGARGAAAEEIREGLARLEEWMGVAAAVLDARRWLVRGDSVWMHSADAWPLEAWGPDALEDPAAGWRFASLGLRAFRRESGGRLRPTNDLLRRLERELRARVIDLSAAEAAKLLEQGDLAVQGTADGYAALRLEGSVVGRGFVRSGRVRHEIPRPDRKSLLEALQVSGAAASAGS